MRKFGVLLILILAFYFAFYFLPKGVIVGINEPTSVGFTESASLSSHCLFTIKIKSWFFESKSGENNVTFYILKNNTVLANYTLKGVKGSYLCLPEGILLYAHYPGDVLGNTSMLFLNYNLSEKWRKEFEGLTLPEYYTNKKILLIKHGSEEWNVKACLYKLNIETGEIISKFCPEPYYGSEILDVKVFKNRIYLTTSRGFLYLLEGNKSKNVFIETIEGIKLGARMKIDANEKYVVVAYFFANEIGKEKNGLCIFTSELEKISCKKFENTPWDVRIKGNIIYVQFRNGSIRAYKIIAP